MQAPWALGFVLGKTCSLLLLHRTTCEALFKGPRIHGFKMTNSIDQLNSDGTTGIKYISTCVD